MWTMLGVLDNGETQMAKKPLNERRWDAEARASAYLADANEAAESGNSVKEEKLRAKGQFWLDRANLLSNQGERPAPKQ